jgi:UMF1 family MFS transporter
MNETKTIVRNDPKTIKAWALFDWANSAYALVITVAIFPGYFMAVTDDQFQVLGINMTDSALYAFAVSAAYLLIALASPFLSGIADYVCSPPSARWPASPCIFSRA